MAPQQARNALLLIALALVLTMTPWFSATAVVPELRNEWELGRSSAAWLTIAVQVGFVAGAVISALGTLPDVLSSRWVIVGGATGAAVANGLLVAVSGPTGAIPLRFVTGFFLAGVYPPALKLMATWFRERRGRALGILVGALTFGSAAPHALNTAASVEWRTVVLGTSALTLTGALLVALFVREGPHPFPRARFDARQVAAVVRNRPVRLASVGYFGHMWELYAAWAWFLVLFSDGLRTRGVPVTTNASLTTFAVIGIGALGCWAGGLLGDRWGRAKTTMAMMAGSGAAAVAVALAYGGPIPLLIAASLVWGFTVVADSAQFSTLVTEFADQSYVGTALTLQLAIGFSLSVTTIWLVPHIEQSAGWPWAVLSLVPGPVLGVLAMRRLISIEAVSRAAPSTL